MSDYERRLTSAFRQADEQAKENALKLLNAHVVSFDYSTDLHRMSESIKAGVPE